MAVRICSNLNDFYKNSLGVYDSVSFPRLQNEFHKRFVFIIKPGYLSSLNDNSTEIWENYHLTLKKLEISSKLYEQPLESIRTHLNFPVVNKPTSLETQVCLSRMIAFLYLYVAYYSIAIEKQYKITQNKIIEMCIKDAIGKYPLPEEAELTAYISNTIQDEEVQPELIEGTIYKNFSDTLIV